MASLMMDLPSQLLHVVAGHLDAATHLALEQTCAAWRTCLRDDALWLPRLEARFPRAQRIRALLGRFRYEHGHRDMYRMKSS